MAEKFYLTVEDGNWRWAEDYFYASARYVVACPSNRWCQVGMGIMAFGQPRGEKVKFKGSEEIFLIGMGALHFRVADGLGPCQIGYIRTAAKGVPISWDF